MMFELYVRLKNRVNGSIFLKNTVLNYSLNIFVYCFSFLSTPLLLKYLNIINFGIYQTILMFLSWAALCNLGIGNGLRNKISEFIGVNDSLRLQRTIGSAFYIAFSLFLIMIILGSLFFIFIFNPQWLFNDILKNASDVKMSFFIAYFFLSLNFIVSLFSSICFGLQKSYWVTFVQLLQASTFCFLIFILIKLDITPNVSIVAFSFGVTLILSNFIPYFYIRKNKQVWPPLYSKRENIHETKSLFNTSFRFLFLQLSTLLLFCSDNFIIAKLLGAESVTEYSIANKLFFFIIGVFSILLIQVWNATAHAKAQNNYIWIEKIVKKLHLALIPIILVSLIVCIFYDSITKLWLGTPFFSSKLFLFIFVFYTIFHCINAIYVNVLNGLSQIKWQMYAYIIAGCLNVFLAYIFIRIFNLDIIGIILSKTICIIFTSIICFIDYKKYVRLNFK